MSAELYGEAVKQAVLAKVPQQFPFRFIDRIIELSNDHIVAEHRFRPDDYFYRGHFPDEPVTPGVILIEAMAQAGLVALGIHLLSQEAPDLKARTLFSDCQIDFLQIVPPGEVVTIRGEKIFWRRRKLQSKVELLLANGTAAARGVVAGSGVVIE